MEHDQRAVALLEHAGPSPAKALVLANLPPPLMCRGDQEAIRVGRQALVMAEDARSRTSYGRVRSTTSASLGSLMATAAASATLSRPSPSRRRQTSAAHAMLPITTSPAP